MSETLAQRDLYDDTKLRFERYELDSLSAEALGRPVGSYEMVLVLESGRLSTTTNPAASHFLNQEDFRRFYDAVKCERDFLEIMGSFRRVNSPESAQIAKSLLGTLVGK